jgi:hypothetical protein
MTRGRINLPGVKGSAAGHPLPGEPFRPQLLQEKAGEPGLGSRMLLRLRTSQIRQGGRRAALRSRALGNLPVSCSRTSRASCLFTLLAVVGRERLWKGGGGPGRQATVPLTLSRTCTAN